MRPSHHIRSYSRRSIVIAVTALSAVAFSGCTGGVSLSPKKETLRYFEQERVVHLNLFRMTLMRRELVRYRERIVDTRADEIAAEYAVLEYTVTGATGDEVTEIHGSKLARQLDETQDLTVMRDLGERPFGVRFTGDGTILDIAAPDNVGGSLAGLSAIEQATIVDTAIQRVFLNAHLLTTRAFIPPEGIREGASYRPDGFRLDAGQPVPADLMVVERIAPDGLATIRMNPSVLGELLSRVAADAPLPPALQGKMRLESGGSATFTFDTKQRYTRAGAMELTARVQPAGEKESIVPLNIKLTMHVREVAKP
ncbi:hypothetical protein K8I61_13385 [bacterium]|nr:hypothetical protein [bacterium]